MKSRVTLSFIWSIWRVLRPEQWVKNAFVLIGVTFANLWTQPSAVKNSLMATLAFSLVASGVYVCNDLFDKAQDAKHPEKRKRPIAANEIGVRPATLLFLLLWFLGLGLGRLVSITVFVILVSYVLVNIGYSWKLKDVVILDVFLIASGFMLRILAGTIGIGIESSKWLLLCGFMLALFLGFAKRRAEIYASVYAKRDYRKVLAQYQPVLLDKMIVITSTCAILCYGLYTLSPATIQTHKTDNLVFTVPFVVYGIFRYLYALHKDHRGLDPAQEIIRDPQIMLATILWFATTVYLLRTGK
ncbi:MAG: decaprenyl-phosphate phosphoribosyltransferase [Pyrinomonas sp.]|uniref:decaprenyl-phosphate phosphoribosyltransferase n=1 Tax=Pyrinomonas sp. TaxID=2080306 RepID=UPI00332557D2